MPSQRRAVARGASEGGGSSEAALRCLWYGLTWPLDRRVVRAGGLDRSVRSTYVPSEPVSSFAGAALSTAGTTRLARARAPSAARASSDARRALVSAPRRPGPRVGTTATDVASHVRVATRVRDRRSRGHRRRLFDTQSWVASPPRARRVTAAGRHESSVCQRCRVLIGERARY